jgi:2-iminobutanoate/2-iminopropanoate deaminase
MEKAVISTDKAPEAIGPYSQAVKIEGLVFVSGQLPLDGATGQLVEGSIGEQTKQVISNIRAVLEAAGSDLSRIVKATLYITSMADFAQVNEAYGTFFSDSPPARVCVEVSRLPKDARIEIDAIATC